MDSAVFARVCELLDAQQVHYDVLRHEPVYTSEQAAAVRGVDLASGAKALICKADDRYLMLVMPADRKLDNKRLRREHGIRRIRFASCEDLAELTGLEPGSVPPFGSLFQLETWCDAALAEQPRINFNAGDHSISVSIPYAAYQQVEQPRIADFTLPPESDASDT